MRDLIVIAIWMFTIWHLGTFAKWLGPILRDREKLVGRGKAMNTSEFATTLLVFGAVIVNSALLIRYFFF